MSAIGTHLIVRAAAFNEIETFRTLLEQKVDPSVCENAALRRAAVNNCVEIVKLLLADPRVNPADKDNYAIRFACLYGQTEIVKLLLADSRVDPFAKDYWCMRYAKRKEIKDLLPKI